MTPAILTSGLVNSDRIGAVLATITSIGVQSITAQPATLEELFLRHYERTPSWPVLLIPVAVAAAVTAAACAMSTRRDVGAGVLADRAGGTGPSRAAPRLGSPLALAWRLHKDQLISWGAGLSMASIALGFMAVSFDELLTDVAIIEDWLATMGGDTVGEAFLAIITFDIRLVVACAAIATALRLRTEEHRGHVEPLLAGPTSRARWMSSHMLIAFAGPGAVLLVVGVSTGLVYGATSGRVDALVDQLGTAMRFLPATWFMAAVAIALFGMLPRAAVAASWGAWGCSSASCSCGKCERLIRPRSCSRRSRTTIRPSNPAPPRRQPSRSSPFSLRWRVRSPSVTATSARSRRGRASVHMRPQLRPRHESAPIAPAGGPR